MARNRESSSRLRISALEAAPKGAAPAVGSGAKVEASGDGGTLFVGTALVDVGVQAGCRSPGTGGGNTAE